MGRVRPASATSEAIEAEVLLKVWDVLHPRAVGEGGGLAVAAEGSGLRVVAYFYKSVQFSILCRKCRCALMCTKM